MALHTEYDLQVHLAQYRLLVSVFTIGFLSI